MNKGYEFQGIKGLFRLSIWIPVELVGRVIGKKGAVIIYLQRTTQTEITVLNIPSQQPCDLWSPLSITGEPNNALLAFNFIKDMVDEIDDIVVEFPMPKQKIYHPLFYGHHTPEFQRLSAIHGTRIHIPDLRDITSGSNITLEGGASGVISVTKYISSLLANPENYSVQTSSKITTIAPTILHESHPFYHSFSISADANQSMVFERHIIIPENLLKVLYRKSNGKYENTYNLIHQIQSLSGVEIHKINHDSLLSITGLNEDDVDSVSMGIARMADGESIHAVLRDLKEKYGETRKQEKDRYHTKLRLFDQKPDSLHAEDKHEANRKQFRSHVVKVKRHFN